MRKRNKCITSYDYVPGFNDLGMTEDEFNDMAYENPIQLEHIIDRWIEENNKKIATTKREKERIASLDAISHWYYNTDHEKIRQAIDKTRVLADVYLNHVISKQKNEKFFIYYSDLQNRVKKGYFSIVNIQPKSLKSLPKYDPVKNEIYGSRTSMVRLWCHVFSLNK